jgi:hypothetical protein
LVNVKQQLTTMVKSLRLKLAHLYWKMGLASVKTC